MVRYLLDANVFMEANNRHYGLDFCPAFWDWLAYANKKDQVFSIDEVLQELLDPELAPWGKSQGSGFFLLPTSAVLAQVPTVAKWANSSAACAGGKYSTKAIYEFLSVADHRLVARALAENFVVVTHEVPSNSPNKIKVPNACKALGVECISPFKMLRDEKARFDLAPPIGAIVAATSLMSGVSAVLPAPGQSSTPGQPPSAGAPA